MSSHTPGPWEQVMTTMIFPADRDPEAQSITLVNVRRDEWQANARLIAAAPDLLAACRRIIQETDRDCIDDSEWSEGERMAHAAITKATKG